MPAEMPQSESGVKWVRGARQCAAAAVRDIGNAVASLRARGIWDKPIRVIASSQRLRAYLIETIAHEAGGAALGVSVHTLRGLALAVARPDGPDRGALFSLWARRAIAADELLGAVLAPFDEGAGVAEGAVRDLLDAGLEHESGLALLELLQADAESPGAARAAGLVRAAMSTRELMATHGVVRSADLYARAADALSRPGANALPTAAFFVYGFPNATGRALDLLEALGRVAPVHAYVDAPADRGEAELPCAGSAFTRAVRERLSALGPSPAAPSLAPEAAPHLTAFSAAGAEAEAREIARRIRLLLDGGVPPESIAIVPRSIDELGLPLRGALRRACIPFSSPSAAPARLTPLGRAMECLHQLALEGEAATVDTWIGAVAPGRKTMPSAGGALPAPRAGRAELSRVLRAAGVRTLGGAAALPLTQQAPALRTTVQLSLDEELGETTRRRGTLAADAYNAALELARHTRELLARWPEQGPLGDHTERFERLASALGWEASTDASRSLRGALAGLHQLEDTPASPPVVVARREWLRLLQQATAAVGEEPLGGAGSGVQVLSALQARGCTFSHLFLPGLHRGSFPRPIQEDPILPDAIRRRMRQVLPDLPVKLEGVHEERYLFAHLLEQAPQVTLSWQRTDDDGRARGPSAFVERLRLSGALPEDAFSEIPSGPGSWRAEALANEQIHVPLREWAIAAALQAKRELACTLAGSACGWPAEATAARRRVLDEVDPELTTPEGRRRFSALGPWHGFVGAQLPQAERRVPITHFEQHASCGWRYFLRRVLGLVEAPAAASPLPALTPLDIGNAVHRAVGALVVPDAAAALLSAELLSAGPVAEFARLEDLPPPTDVPKPGPAEIAAATRRAAEAEVANAGLGGAAFAHVLATLSQPHVERAVALLWSTEPLRSRAAEAEGHVDPFAHTQNRRVVHAPSGQSRDASPPMAVAFRADLVLVAPDGGLRLVDLKTGRPPFTAVKATTRAQKLAAFAARGELLQGLAYALASEGGTGEYLWTRPDVDERAARLEISAGDPVATSVFPAAVHVLSEARRHGVFPPRVEGPDESEPQACARCEVSAACVRGDSGHRRRLREAAATDPHPQEPVSHRLFRQVWTGSLATANASAPDEDLA